MSDSSRGGAVGEGVLACCPFRIGDALLLCPVESVEAITMWEDPITLPRVPDHILGLVTYDQRALAVLDLGRFLGLAEGESYTRTLVIKADEYRVGVPVDTALGVVEVAAADRQPPSGAITGALATYLAAEVPLDDGLAALLDLPRLLEAARA